MKIYGGEKRRYGVQEETALTQSNLFWVGSRVLSLKSNSMGKN